MSTALKAGLGIAAAVVLGLAIGYGAGHYGKAEVQRALDKAKQRAEDAEENLKRESEQCARRMQEARTAKQLLLSQQELLRATLEIFSNNFGLASQHLAQSRSWLRSAQSGLKAKDLAKARALFDRIGEAQTLAMRLDPVARVQIDQIVAELQKLPGAR